MKNLYLKNIDVKISSGELVGIIGANASGKTELLKKIMGRLNNNGIIIDNKDLKDYDMNFKRNNIVCVYDDNLYNTSNVSDELKYYLNLLNRQNYMELLDDFCEYFSLKKIINEDFIDLSIEDRVYIKILSLLIIKPLIICIDDLLTYLSIEKKIKILNFIKENNITLLSVTSNMEELLFLDKILILSRGNKVIYDNVNTVLKKEEIFKEYGLGLPFINEINNLLKSYELIKENHVTYKELVDLLWK